MTIFLVIIIVLCFALIGYKLANYYLLRKKFFASLLSLLSFIELDVSFSQSKLKDIISQNSSGLQSLELKTLCENICEKLIKKELLDSEIFNGITILKKEERTFVLNVFSSLGKFDAINSSKEIKNFNCSVEEYYNNANDEYKKYGSLFIKLGVCVGLLVCLLVL